MVTIKDTDNVFINCPFDPAYKPMFDAIVFAIFDCGFRARCSLEEEDTGEVRIDKILRIIRNCRYGLHDISRTELCPDNNLPRFNMPLELGLFIGAKKYGNDEQSKKKYIVFDRDRYRFQMFISDIAGQDIKNHNNEPERAMRAVQSWLSSSSNRKTVPTFKTIQEHYSQFQIDLPGICLSLNHDITELTFNDYATLVTEWLSVNA